MLYYPLTLEGAGKSGVQRRVTVVEVNTRGVYFILIRSDKIDKIIHREDKKVLEAAAAALKYCSVLVVVWFDPCVAPRPPPHTATALGMRPLTVRVCPVRSIGHKLELSKHWG